MKNQFAILSFIMVMLCSYSCKNDKTKVTPAAEAAPILKYNITPFTQSPSFPDAKLSDMKYTDGMFTFNVENYELGAQTDDADSKMCANSAKGQHIHLIVNKDPYAAKYVNQFEHEVPDGEHHILAFLSRSYHESIKTANAHIAQKVIVSNGSMTEKEDIKDPMLFYSRPKGTYVGKKNTEKVMLDFYLCNTQISETGNYVEANINGEIHKITKWQPYFIEGLPIGENYVGLVIKDKDGKELDNPLNPVKRIFTLKEDLLEE